MRALLSVLLLGVLWLCPFAVPGAAVADSGTASPFEGRYEGAVTDAIGRTWYVDIKIEKDGEIKGGVASQYFAGRVAGAVDDAGVVLEFVGRFHYRNGAANAWFEWPFVFVSVYVYGDDLYLYDSDRGASFVLTRS